MLSGEGDLARVIEITQGIVEQFEKTPQLLGVSVQMGDGKRIMMKGSGVAVGASGRSAGS